MIKLKKLIFQQLTKQDLDNKIQVTNKDTGQTYQITKGYWQKHKHKYQPAERGNVSKKSDKYNTKKSKPKPQDHKQIVDKFKSQLSPMNQQKQISDINRQKISMLLDKLAQAGNQARQKGQKAPNYNLCQITVPGTNLYCQGNKEVPRQNMPQFKGYPVPGSKADKMPKDHSGQVDTQQVFKSMLNKKGIGISDTVLVQPDRLKATQSQLVGVKVAGMRTVLDDKKHPAYDKITAPIYVSRDGYVLDGHHRWAAIVSHNIKNPNDKIDMKVKIIDDDIVPLVKKANDFARDIGIKAKAADTGKKGG